jgi:hypothetical protein
MDTADAVQRVSTEPGQFHFTPEFTEQASTLAQWTAFRKKLPNTECPETLAEVVLSLAAFLLPIARACAAGESFEQRWRPGGPWTSGA